MQDSRRCLAVIVDDNLFGYELSLLRESVPLRLTGRVEKVIGLVIEGTGLSLPVGSLCEIHAKYAVAPIHAEVVGFRDERILLMPLGEMQGVSRHDSIVCISRRQTVGVGEELLGRVVDAFGREIDGKGPIYTTERRAIYRGAPKPMARARISEPLATGIKAIDALVTFGKGQRMGLFSGSGVGKSILLGMVARNTEADVSVICLVGERGREVRDFIEKALGEEGLARSVVVVATSDEPALLRTRAPYVATAIAEYFRDRGNDVMLMMDSITRMSNAQREIGLSIGEPPATKGYPPSVFAHMPRLLERAGRNEHGSITGVYTVLVEADDITEPIADTARSILDGHVWLSRELANKGFYPSIDPLQSISRVMIDVVTDEHKKAAERVRAMLAVYRTAEDLINIGAYVKGSNPEIDKAIEIMPRINSFLRQGIYEKCSYGEIVRELLALV